MRKAVPIGYPRPVPTVNGPKAMKRSPAQRSFGLRICIFWVRYHAHAGRPGRELYGAALAARQHT
jgi:hypothetical protein